MDTESRPVALYNTVGVSTPQMLKASIGPLRRRGKLNSCIGVAFGAAILWIAFSLQEKLETGPDIILAGTAFQGVPTFCSALLLWGALAIWFLIAKNLTGYYTVDEGFYGTLTFLGEAFYNFRAVMVLFGLLAPALVIYANGVYFYFAASPDNITVHRGFLLASNYYSWSDVKSISLNCFIGKYRPPFFFASHD